MTPTRQCSVCDAGLAADDPRPRRLFFAGREHRFCSPGCLLAFKRAPEAHAHKGAAVVPGAGGPPVMAPPRTAAPSPFRVRVGSPDAAAED